MEPRKRLYGNLITILELMHLRIIEDDGDRRKIFVVRRFQFIRHPSCTLTFCKEISFCVFVFCKISIFVQKDKNCLTRNCLMSPALFLDYGKTKKTLIAYILALKKTFFQRLIRDRLRRSEKMKSLCRDKSIANSFKVLEETRHKTDYVVE